jgi:hypothetical protein
MRSNPHAQQVAFAPGLRKIFIRFARIQHGVIVDELDVAFLNTRRDPRLAVVEGLAWLYVRLKFTKPDANEFGSSELLNGENKVARRPRAVRAKNAISKSAEVVVDQILILPL